MRPLEIYIDGASQGNPGPAGIGVIICQGECVLKNIARFIGNTTNNVAEYTALIYALQETLIMHAEDITVKTDSELLYRQIIRQYKVKNANLLGLYNQALHLIPAFKNFKIQHIPREHNRGADKLATKAIRQARKKGGL